jgi:hypothetical protein
MKTGKMSTMDTVICGKQKDTSVDSEGSGFSFQEGMVFVFDQKKNMHTDYTSVGTH